MLKLYSADIIKKIQYYLNRYEHKVIHPIHIRKNTILIKTTEHIKTIDNLSIHTDNINDIQDVCLISHIDRVI